MRKSKRGFSLIEMLLALLVLGVLCGGMVLTASERDVDAKRLQMEADRLGIWLSNKMAEAQVRDSDFRVQLSQWQPYNYDIRLRWLDGTNKEEVYMAASKTYIYTTSASKNFAYSREWHTVTPAITFRVKKTADKTATGITVTVSGQGYVTVGTL